MKSQTLDEVMEPTALKVIRGIGQFLFSIVIVLAWIVCPAIVFDYCLAVFIAMPLFGIVSAIYEVLLIIGIAYVHYSWCKLLPKRRWRTSLASTLCLYAICVLLCISIIPRKQCSLGF